MSDGTFLDPEVRQSFSGPHAAYSSFTCTSMNSTNNPPQATGSSRRRYQAHLSPQEDSYYDQSYMNGTQPSYREQNQRMGAARKDMPQNCKSVVSLPDDEEHSSSRNPHPFRSGHKTWPPNRGLGNRANISQEQLFSDPNAPESCQSIHSLRSISPPQGMKSNTSGASPYQERGCNTGKFGIIVLFFSKVFVGFYRRFKIKVLNVYPSVVELFWGELLILRSYKIDWPRLTFSGFMVFCLLSVLFFCFQ